MMAEYSGLVAFVYDEKIKELELLDRMLKTTQASEKHQLEMFVEYQAAYLNEENARFDQLIRYVSLAAEIQEKIAQGELAADDQRFNQLMQIEGAYLQRFQVEGDRDAKLQERGNNKEIALKELANSNQVAQWNSESAAPLAGITRRTSKNAIGR